MTTTAATSSASSSASNDSPVQQDECTVVGFGTNINHQKQQQQQQPSKQPNQSSNNSNEQKRPMNAFLLFCKSQRSLVREKYPNLENREITKILGDWWTKLDKDQKSEYTDLARQYKEAFMKANPDFKWCKTPISSNSNNPSSGVDCLGANDGQANGSNLPLAHNDTKQTSSRESTLASRQNEAPKPPKKRFLERNDSVYIKYHSSQNETTSHAKDSIVPYLSLDQDTLDRVIDEAFSEKSNSNPSGVNPTSSSTSATSPSYSNGADEPVDFSMNRTINATRQQIINNLVEKMLSVDNNVSSIPRMNGTEGSQSQQPGTHSKKDCSEVT